MNPRNRVDHCAVLVVEEGSRHPAKFFRVGIVLIRLGDVLPGRITASVPVPAAKVWPDPHTASQYLYLATGNNLN